MWATSFLLIAQLVTPVYRNLPAAGGAAAAPDWCANEAGMVACWMLDEASGTRDNTGGCGADCDLDVSTNNPGSDTGTFIEGIASADFDNATAEDLRCTIGAGAGECDELAISGSFAAGCWINVDTDASEWYLNSSDTTTGFRLARSALNDKPQFAVLDGSDVVSLNGTNNTLQTIDGWVHFIGIHHGGATDTIAIYLDGAADTGPSTQQDMASSGAGSFGVSWTASSSTAWQDECFVFGGDVTTDADFACYVCSCGPNGSQCQCDGDSFDDAGRNVSDCGSCSLPASCQNAAP